jgi:hypothetical protein
MSQSFSPNGMTRSPKIEHDPGVELFPQRSLPSLARVVELHDRRVGHDQVDRVLDGSYNNGAIFTGL